ncbi:MAG: bifunctional DNA primase/polymerase [Acidobacteriaceae bacterium]
MSNPQTHSAPFSKALELAEAGLPVFPLAANKRPLTEHGFKDATRDPAVVREWVAKWPSALIGVPTGRASGLFVLDIDRKHGVDGFATLTQKSVSLPLTRIHQTTSGGSHYLFRWPEGTSLSISAGKLGGGLDTRGEGGYIVWWPACGLPVLCEEEPAALPGWIVDALTEKPRTAPAESSPISIVEGARNAVLTSLAGTMRRKGMVQTGIEAALLAENAACCRPPLEESEVLRIARSISRYEPAKEQADADDAPRLVQVDLATKIRSEIPPPRFIIERILPRNFVTLFSGHGGAGKSQLALTLLAHVACGKAWGALNVIHGRAAFVSYEDPWDLMVHRLQRIARQYTLDLDALGVALAIFDASDVDSALAVETMEAGHRRLITTPAMFEMERATAGNSLIAIDNASDVFDGDENSKRQVRTFMKHLIRHARQQDAAILLLAHVDKAGAKFGTNGNSYSGSVAWHNSARSRMALLEDNGRLVLHHEKLNLGAKGAGIQLVWTQDGVLIPAADTSGITQTAFEQSDDAAVLAAITQATEMGASVPTGRTGASTALSMLKTFPDLPSELRKDRDRFWGALSRLERAGKIARNKYKSPSRHIQERFICARS